MLILIALLLALIPAIAILYPFLRRQELATAVDDQESDSSDLSRRLDSAMSGLKNNELEHALGNLTEDDYRVLRRQYMDEAAAAMKAMDLQDQEEHDFLADLKDEVRSLRDGLSGEGDESLDSSEREPGPARTGD